MASSYEVEVKLSSANNLKNVNWRNGPNRPYAIVWVDPTQKCSTTVDHSGDTKASWDDKLLIPLSLQATVDESNLFVNVLHAATNPEAKPILIGSARLSLADIRNDVGFGERTSRTLKLKRPSGRPQGTVDVKIVIRNTGYRAPPNAYDAPPYGVPQPAPPMYGTPYSAAPVAPTPAPYGSSSYSAAPPTTGYAANALYGSSYNAAPPTTGYAAAAPYGQATGYGYGQSGQQSYGYGQSEQQSYGYGQAMNVGGGEKKSKFGLGTGLAMGAVVGGLGALVLEKGVDAVEDKIADRAAEKVEEDFYDDF